MAPSPCGRPTPSLRCTRGSSRAPTCRWNADMCGICGVFGRSDMHTVRTMLASLTHRGPADAHAVGGADFSLGACRLSIVDVEGGRQPLANEDGTVWAAQNGELYNFPALRRELLAR